MNFQTTLELEFNFNRKSYKIKFNSIKGMQFFINESKDLESYGGMRGLISVVKMSLDSHNKFDVKEIIKN